MNEIFKIFFFMFLISLLNACNSKTDKVPGPSETLTTHDNPPRPCEEYSTPLDIVNRTDTLKILIQLSDCGEWGGHRESIYLRRDEDNKIFVRFIIDSVSCDKIIEKDEIGVLDDKARVTVLDTTKLLDVEDEKLASIFLQRLLELYLKNEIDSNAGTVYNVINTNSTLNFIYWNSGDCRNTYYGRLRKRLLGEIK